MLKFAFSIGVVLAVILFSGCRREAGKTIDGLHLTYLIGEVAVNNRPASLNQGIDAGMIITTGQKSIAEIKIGKQGGFQIRENSRVTVERNTEGWNPVVGKGAVLSLLRPGTHYKLAGTAAVIAVRGTIFYTNCYDDSTQYACTCNGTVQLNENGNLLKQVSATHHEPYLVRRTPAGARLEPAEMREHDDIEIFEFMYRMERSDAE